MNSSQTPLEPPKHIIVYAEIMVEVDKKVVFNRLIQSPKMTEQQASTLVQIIKEAIETYSQHI